MKPHLIILGAGSSRNEGRPLGLQKVTLERRVLDWQLDAFSLLNPEVSFVGGYDIDKVMQSFPKLAYHFNAEWQSTGSVASLALALASLEDISLGNRDLYITYSDILLRPELIEAMAAQPADRCTIGVDILSNDSIPETLELQGERKEFIGLIRVPAVCAASFCNAVLEDAPLLRQDHLSKLFDGITRQRPQLGMAALPATGQWAHAEHGRSVARFVLGSKAATLDRLQRRLKHSRILPLSYFTREAWLHNRSTTLEQLLARFSSEQHLIVRSSATDEDGFENANAGRYYSELDVQPELTMLGDAVDRVFSSYAGIDPLDEVLVQPQLDNVLASGVIFTRALETGSPYRVINYTMGSDTTAITGGASRDGIKLYVSRFAPERALLRLSALDQRLIVATDEIEACVCHDALDIEFAIDDNDQLITLQVRPLMVSDIHQDRDLDVEVADCLDGMHAALKELATAPAGQVGQSAAWSVMADWNPAEIIGLTPSPLAMDLYRHIITDRIWAIQRHEVGYRDVRNWPLIRSFGGQAFVDVRASMNSFIPAALSDDQARRMIDYALNLLGENPALHDKLEFELIPTCLDFGFDRWTTRYLESGVCDIDGIFQLRNALRSVTENIIKRTPGNLLAAQELEIRCHQLILPSVPYADWLRQTLSICSTEGALTFSHLARAGFAAAALLRSAVARNLLTDARRAELMESIPSVGHMLTDAALAVREGNISRQTFLDRFGHLRPGTYDITTPAYRDQPEDYLDPVIATAQHRDTPNFSWTEDERAALDSALESLAIGIDAEQLLTFTRTAVAGREYSKFVFTKLLSAALDSLAANGKALGIATNQLDCMPLITWLEQSIHTWGIAGARKELTARTEIRYRQHRLAGRILLPPVLTHPDEIYAFAVPPSEPTFITTRQVRAALRIVQPGQVLQRESVEGCVVAIMNADPGFDYLFALGILGLITAFGGPNSHMAIRASEFSIPAVIGIGEQTFNRLADGLLTEVDCQKRRWQQEDLICAP